MPREYALFSIRIRGAGPDSYTIDVQSALGGDASGAFVTPARDPRYQELARRLQSLDTDEDLLIELGTILFQSIFQGGVKEVYARSQGRLAEGQGLRLRLDLDPAQAEIAGLPWEFLYDPDQGPLALLDAPIVRYLSQQSAPPMLQTTLPLKVLVTSAVTPPAPDVERELAEVRAALAGLERSGHVAIRVEEHLTQPVLQRRLREGFQVWHFIGHGGFSRDGRSGTLVFEDGAGSSKAVSAAELNILLNRSGVRLILLDACDSARLTTEPYRSVAPALVRAQVPAVIAMQFTVPQEATRAFAGEFYRALAEGLPIDACVTEGRKAVMGETGLRNPDWGIPVVYTRAPDGRLFDPAAPATATPARPAAGNSVVVGSGNVLQPGSSINISGVGSTSVQPDDEERRDRIAELEGLIKANKSRLYQRELQKARYGISADPSITIEVEDLTREIAKLERELQTLR
ncbi:MAG: CHAT domain-containing protein [Kouleothrix sp.]|nr:CHAT domain-containing protein [Kouleothrix sp.]